MSTGLRLISYKLQYLKLGGAILRFNLDPAFSNALDGLVVVNLLKSDKKQLERYMGKEGVGDFLACVSGGNTLIFLSLRST